MKKRWLSGIMAGIFLTGMLGGCSDKGTDFVETKPTERTEESSETADEPSQSAESQEMGTEQASIETSAEATEEVQEFVEVQTVSDSIKTDGWSSLRKSVNLVNWDLYLYEGQKKNVFYSPFSIVSAMGLTDLAAKGETKEQIEKALHMDDSEAFRQEMMDYLAKNKESDTTYFRSANAIWLSNKLVLSDSSKTDFFEPATKYFDGFAGQLDFQGNLAKSKETIKDWVSDNTDGFINDYDSSATEDTFADIMNAVYFYGEWMNKFKAEDTVDGEFHGTNGDTTEKMMNLSGDRMSYLADKDGVTALAVPYSDGKLEMDIMMSADEGKTINDVFDPAKADEILEELNKAEEAKLGTFRLPKFSMDAKYNNLTDIFKSWGMDAAFSENADFTGLADKMYISDIAHQAKIEVDEEGSRAAAVTEAMLGITSIQMPEDEVDFIVDRPFVFVIRDKESGIILFTGRINNLGK